MSARIPGRLPDTPRNTLGGTGNAMWTIAGGILIAFGVVFVLAFLVEWSDDFTLPEFPHLKSWWRATFFIDRPAK